MKTKKIVKIELVLKESQIESEFTWKCHVFREKRIVLSKRVVYYCDSVQRAVNSFEEDEVESFFISG